VTPDWDEILLEAIESKLLDTHVSLPGRIQNYDKDTRSADVVIEVSRLLKKEDGSYIAEELPTLKNVPVIMPKTLSWMVHLPVENGTKGDVIFSEVSIGQWRALDKKTDPEDVGRHTLSGGKFYPGLFSDLAIVSGDGLVDGFAETEAGIAKTDGSIKFSMATDGTITVINNSGKIEIKPNGQVNINDVFTVDP